MTIKSSFDNRLNLVELINKLPVHHVAALKWFFINSNRIIDFWPGEVKGILLASKAKGIYKPQWSKYALSIRQSLSSPYKNQEPIFREDGTWSYAYYQENEDPTLRDKEYTNRALMACLEDKIPVGVIRQIKAKPGIQYHILGLALVVKWDSGYFFLEGFSSQGLCYSEEFYYINNIIGRQTINADNLNWFDYNNIVDTRAKIVSSIVIRRGQPAFRKRMLEEYDGKCTISGCSVQAVLEAAHIVPYRGSYTDNPDNGLLLRADIHILFDIGLITINPETFTVEINNELIKTPYKVYEGKRINLSRSGGPSKKALDLHRKWARGEY